MKKILFVICIMCFFMACSKESNSSSSSSSTDESAEISNISYKIAESDKEHITQAVEGLKNIIIKDDFDLSVSKDLQSIRSFNQGYYPFLSNKEAYDRFFECVPKFFENRDFNANSVVFSGEIFSKLLTEYYDKVDEIRNYVFNTEGLREEAANIRIDELIKEKGLVEPELPKVKDYEDELFNDDTSVLMYIYQDTGKEDETPIFMEAQSPIGNGIFRFNRGVAVDRFFKAQNQEVPFMETYDQLRWFGDMVKSVRPDSEEEVKMLDKTVTVKEAVSVFENYFNSLDFIDNKCADIKVKRVDIYDLNDGVYGLQMICTSKYKNIEFDYLNGLSQSSEGETGNSVFCYGMMVKSDEADTVYNLPLCPKIEDEKEIKTMISASEAVKLVSGSLSQEVEFVLEDASLVYFVEKTQNVASTNPEDVHLPAVTAWKFTLLNQNDKVRYVCYVNAEDGSNFHYYKLLGE